MGEERCPTSEWLDLQTQSMTPVMLWPECQTQVLSGGSRKDGDQLAGLAHSGVIPKKQLVGLEGGPCWGWALPDVTHQAQLRSSFPCPFLGSWKSEMWYTAWKVKWVMGSQTGYFLFSFIIIWSSLCLSLPHTLNPLAPGGIKRHALPSRKLSSDSLTACL